MPMFIDPTAGARMGLESLSGSLERIKQSKRQQAQDTVTAKKNEQALELGDLKLGAARQKRNYQQGLAGFEESLSTQPDLSEAERFAKRGENARKYGQIESFVNEGRLIDITNKIGDRENKVMDNLRETYQYRGEEAAVQYAIQNNIPEEKARDMLKGYNVFPDHEEFSDGMGGKIMRLKDPSGKMKYFQTKAPTTTSGSYDPQTGNITTAEGMVISSTEIDSMARDFLITGKMPSLGMKAGPIRQAIVSRGKSIQDEMGIGSGELMALQSEAKGLYDSMRKQEINIGAAGSYVANAEKQIDRMNTEIIPKLKDKRTGIKLFNIPLRAWDKYVVGDDVRSAYEMYLTEISNEVARLSAGNPASIAELSQHAQKVWSDIHDPNLSPSDIKKLLAETKHAIKMRIDSLNEQRNRTQDRLDGILDYKKRQNNRDRGGKKETSTTEKPTLLAFKRHFGEKYPDKTDAELEAAYTAQHGAQ